MTLTITPRKLCYLFCIVLLFFIAHLPANAQCDNWKPVATLINGSNCAANGSFSVSLTGADAGNLTNIQYGIPLNAAGFSVPLNNASSFSGIPPGTYTVSVVANCGGVLIGKNTTIRIPGNYTAPAIFNLSGYSSADCPGLYGTIAVHVVGGRAPFTVNIVNASPSYTGPVSFVMTGNQYTIGNVPSGTYNIQVRDACGSGTAPQTVIVSQITFSSFDIGSYSLNPITCDSIFVTPAGFPNNAWSNLINDTASLKVSMFINGITPTATPFVPFSRSGFLIKLPAGKTIKDCYGKTITFTVTLSCGTQTRTFSHTISPPTASTTAVATCSSTFNGSVSVDGPVCLPLTGLFTNNATGATYGPYTATGGGIMANNLPSGSYSCTITTSDGYVLHGGTGTSPVPPSPYRVDVLSGAPGLQNYIEGFIFRASIVPRNANVELFSGPPGYTFRSAWQGNQYNTMAVTQNASPFLPNSLYFIPGNYVWKITDECGTYYLPVTVGPEHLYQFTAGVSRQRQACEGLWIWPYATATSNGIPVPARFSISQNGWYWGWNGNWPQFTTGDSVLLTQDGDYTIVPSATTYTTLIGNYPNPYSSTYSFKYTAQPVMVDINHTQGFLCAGASTGQGQVYVSGMGGVPFMFPAHYKYYLAASGNGVSGPYLQNNTTGIFNGLSAVSYDVKVLDSCGAFAVQQIKMLDLARARLISSTRYVACENDDVQLSAAYLPNATYSWTGPNGFSSSLRSPVLPQVNAQNVGVYRVTITTPLCGLPVTDSTIVTVNGAPPKPTITLNCNDHSTASLKINNPSPLYNYEWDVAEPDGNGVYEHYEYESYERDSAYRVYVWGPAYWRGIAIDTISGCRSYSDSVNFINNPLGRIKPRIYSPHLQLCTGDTATLIAQPVLNGPVYQWYRNNVPIPGAHTAIYVTNIPGNYKISVDGGLCVEDTSREVAVTIIPDPTATIAASARVGCVGDVINLQANTGTGYFYTWQRDSTTIPGFSGSQLAVTQTGIYRVTVANGGCARTSDTIGIIINPAPVIALTPNTDQNLCGTDSVTFTTPANSLYTYSWYRDGLLVPGVTANTYTTATSGSYTLKVATTACPNVTAGPVNVVRLPGIIDLGNDTVICQPGTFAINLSLKNGYDQIEWSGGQSSNSITIIAPGLYWVKASNKCGTFTDSLHVRALSEYDPKLADEVLICNDANREVFTVPALLQNILWSTGATTASIGITEPGRYWVKGESPCGILYDTMNVRFCVPDITAIRLPSDTICEGDCIALSAAIENYPQHYRWAIPGGFPDSSAEASPSRVCYANTGIYPITLWVSNAGGSDSLTTNIVVAARPVPRFEDTTFTVSYKKSVMLPACAEAAVANWYKDDSLICSGCKTITLEGRMYRTVYHCVVSNGGCADSCIYKMQVIDIPHDVWLPDAFTPNGDGRNDVFRIITDNPNVYGVDLSVYNRWGQKIYISHTREDGWDGRMNGQPVDAGTYFWTLVYKVLGTDESFKKKGDLILIR